MTELLLPISAGELEASLETIPNRPAVFLLWPKRGEPYLARTNVLRRRLTRLLGATESSGDQRSRRLNLRGTIERLEYQFTGSALEAQFLLADLARRHLGPDYRKAIRLRMPPYIKLILTNEFPRTQIAARLAIGRAKSLYFGPFRNRSTAARFESEFLDLFQLRRCQEDLAPSPDHPGCIYGEMGRCLRPCQQRVTPAEYRSESQRVADFLHTAGRSLLECTAAARDRYSADLDFEGAALMHQRHQRIENVLSLKDEMVRDVDSLHAVAIVPSAEPESIALGWLRGGHWQGFHRLELAAADGTTVSLDTRIREAAALAPAKTGPDRTEQLAIISRWFYSTWCDGELILFESWDKLPVRRLVNAVSRVAQRKPRQSTRSS